MNGGKTETRGREHEATFKGKVVKRKTKKGQTLKRRKRSIVKVLSMT